jgi:glucosamine--fructose-6-phosphate aminotransferase (isomerizing)
MRAKEAGAFVISLVNDESAPLASMADAFLPLRAGTEQSVAATKSFIAALAGLAQLAAEWADDATLRQSVQNAPRTLAEARDSDWSSALETLKPARSLFVLGRGLGLSVAQEAALKLKETCGLHAEAYSSAEVRHGPMAIIDKGFPILAFRNADETGAGMDEVLEDFRKRGASVLASGDALPLPSAPPEIAPLAFIQAFYPFASDLSLARGLNPDAPPSLRKVTETR